MRRPSAGSILAWLRQRLRDLRYLFGDLLYTLVRVPRAIGSAIAGAFRGVRRFFGAISDALWTLWDRVPVIARRRIAALLVIAAAGAAFVEFAVPELPCEFPAGDRCPPADDAAELVPADSLAYVHLNVDPDTEQYERLADLANRVPLFASQIAQRGLGLVPGPDEAAPDFARDLDPWFTGEAAISILGAPTAPARVALLETDDPDAATAYAESIAVGGVTEDEYRGTRISSDERDLATARVEDFLVVGSVDGVRAIVDTATGADGAAPLADDEAAEEIRDELPDHRFVEAWLSRAGTSELVADDEGTLGSLAPLLSPGTTTGAAISLSVGDDSLELAVRSALDPERERSSPGFFAAFPSFEPSLPDHLGAETLAFLGFGEPRRTVRALLDQAVAQAPGIATGFAELVERLRTSGDVDIESDLLPALGDEAAFAIGPGASDDSAQVGLPYLEFIADEVDEERAGRALAALLGAVAEEVDPAQGLQAPVFDELEIAGVEARSLRVSPAIELTSAVFEGLAVVATDPAGVAQLADLGDGLDQRDEFERATDGFPDEVSMSAFFDLRALLAEGYEIGLAQVPAFNAFAADFRTLEALGLAVSSDEGVLATDARVLFGEAGDDGLTSAPDD